MRVSAHALARQYPTTNVHRGRGKIWRSTLDWRLD